MNVRNLDEDDYGYALAAWREGSHKAPGHARLPWSYFKDTMVPLYKRLLDDPSSVVLGAYSHEEKLLGWLVMTPSKRVNTVHWVHVKHELDGKPMRRRGVMTALLDAANLGSRFAYTLHGRLLDREDRQGGAKSLDEILVAALRARGVTATYVPLKEWLK